MRLFTIMDVALTILNGLLIVAVVGWAVWLWAGMRDGRDRGGGDGADAAAQRDDRLDHVGGVELLPLAGCRGRRDGDDHRARHADRRAGRQAARFDKGEIRSRGCLHHYGRGAGGLDRLSLTIRPGEKVGLIGRSGAGKSTLVKLLLRFYDVEKGRILIDGQDIAGVTQDSLRHKIGMVQQDSALLHRSVRDNILYGRPDATEAEMIAAARTGRGA
jgi:ATP-binding cassette subfamily B multidrug efflux pump